ncbi:hypothetical protein BHE74_00049452 [Ensete ventricosum]|nr:hypothetical protein BHE74_00049452 [Ensete ventricosum]RZS02638.1 hypothetical protein BHM03_00032713 [Ensete ventricosum]
MTRAPTGAIDGKGDRLRSDQAATSRGDCLRPRAYVGVVACNHDNARQGGAHGGAVCGHDARSYGRLPMGKDSGRLCRGGDDGLLEVGRKG